MLKRPFLAVFGRLHNVPVWRAVRCIFPFKSNFGTWLVTGGAALGLVITAFAAPSYTSSTFPLDGYMLADYTYTGAATYGNMGVYSDSVSALAEYSDVTYNVTAGNYLPAGAETVAQCTAGNFCAGLSSPVYYDANNAQGLTACSTLENGAYPNSAAGATANTDCYATCTTSNVAHSTAVTGNDYYGAGLDTCSATTCETGWHMDSFNAEDIIGTTGSSAYGYINISGGGVTRSEYNLTDNGSFGITYKSNKGIIKGHAQCSSRGVENPWYDDSNYTFSEDHFVSTLPDSTGQNCYCTVDEYIPVSGDTVLLSGPWVFDDGRGTASNCASNCATYCISALASTAGTFAVRSAILGSRTAIATCEATEYNVSAGTYLPAASETVTQCPVGNFCAGLTGPVYYDANNAQGLTACSTLDNGAYPNSTAGATANTDCYRACTTANVAHSATVTGNDYYGAAVDTCAATTCESGYRVKPGFDLNETIGTVGASRVGYANNKSWGSHLNDDVFNLPDMGVAAGAFAVEYDNNKGTVKGVGMCSGKGGKGAYSNPAATLAGEITTSASLERAGNNCWCMFNEYISADGESMSLSGPWVFLFYSSDMNNCANECGHWCAQYLGNTTDASLLYRTAFLDSVHAVCELTDYTVSAGEYLPAGAETVAQCTAGNFCAGLSSPVYYDANNAQGLTSCSTLDNGAYPNSAVGATAETDCYKACTTANVAHSTAVTGNDYYGAGVDTCAATACEAGYGVSNGVCELTACTGATYMDANQNTCIACPNGYDYNTTMGKTSVTQCQIACAGGTYIDAAAVVPPAEYVQLEYIETTGTQYINTGISSNGVGLKTQLKAQRTGNMPNTSVIIGRYNPGVYVMMLSDRSVSLYHGPGQQVTAYTDDHFSIPMTITGEITSNSMMVDVEGNVTYYEGYVDNDMGVAPIYLFRHRDSNNEIHSVIAKTYYVKIWQNGTLVRDFVPARRKSDNVVGMYDTVTETFFTNAGTDDFIAGPSAGCVDVGTGYYAAASVVNYGSVGTRTACSNKPAYSSYSGSAATNDCPFDCNIGYELNSGVCTQIVCAGANYWAGGCLACPVGYRDNTNSGKVGINSCQISCPAGTYVAEPADETLSAIPDDYTQLEYLSSNGNQYIDTGFTHSSPNIRGEVFVSFPNDVPNSTNMNIMGNQENSSAHTGYSVGWNKFFKLWTESSNSRLSGPDYALTAGTVHKLIFGLTDTTRLLTYADQTVSDTFVGGNIVGSKNIFLFDSGNRQTSRLFNGRVHKITLYEDDVLVHEFVPVIRNNDSVVGIYDITTGTFMTNSGTGSFGAGPAMDNTAGTCVDVGAGYYSAAQMTNYGSTGVRTACSNTIPANSSYSGSATTNACPWACDTGATEYAGGCHNVCPVGGAMHVGNANYPLFADRSNVTNPTLHLRDANGNVCYMYFEPDTPENYTGLKFLHIDGIIYHAIDPR